MVSLEVMKAYCRSGLFLLHNAWASSANTQLLGVIKHPGAYLGGSSGPGCSLTCLATDASYWLGLQLGLVAQSTYTWPFYVSWASSQHGGFNVVSCFTRWLRLHKGMYKKN